MPFSKGVGSGEKRMVRAALMFLLLSAAPTLADELPSEYFGTWGADVCRKGNISNGGFEVSSKGVRYDHTFFRVRSVGSTHPGWHTDTIVLACDRGVGRSREIWHVQSVEGHDFLATVQLTRDGSESADGPSMG